jgi:hypothetical protein
MQRVPSPQGMGDKKGSLLSSDTKRGSFIKGGEIKYFDGKVLRVIINLVAAGFSLRRNGKDTDEVISKARSLSLSVIAACPQSFCFFRNIPDKRE